MDIIDHTPGTLVFTSKPLANGFSSIHQHEVWTYISLKKMEKLALFEYTCCCSICSMNLGDFFLVGCHMFHHVSPCFSTKKMKDLASIMSAGIPTKVKISGGVISGSSGARSWECWGIKRESWSDRVAIFVHFPPKKREMNQVIRQ